MKKIFTLLLLSAFAITAYSQDYVLIGNEKYEAEDYAGAIEDYKKAIEQNPKDDAAWYNIGMAQRELGSYSESIDNFSKAIEITPNYTDAIYQRGFSKEDIGSSAEAIEDYTKVLEIDPAYLKAYFERGYSKITAGLYVEAIGDLTAYVDKGGGNPENAYFQIAISKNRQLLYDEAMEYLEKAAKAGKKDAEVIYEVAFAQEGLQQWAKALEAYTKVTELSPEMYDAWHGRGLCKILLGDADGGCADLTKADELGSLYAYDDMILHCGAEDYGY